MATQKTWTAHDITKDKAIVMIQQPGGMIRFAQDYQFLDASSEIIESLGTRVSMTDIAFASLPQSIQDALISIRDYLYNKALEIEGMDDPV